jgi:3-methyladenine DNA glycosylase AlkD
MPSNSDAAAARAISRRICVQSGDTVSEVRAFRRGLSRELQAEPARSVIAIAVHLSQAPQPWHRFIAYELILHHPLAPSQIDPRSVVQLGKGMAAWQDVDCFAPYISGPAWRDGRIPTALVHRWAGSKDRWWRRAALVSTVPLNVRSQGGRGDAARTLAVCDLLLGDRDPMVVKALSWALRVLSVRDPDAVRVYVASRKGKLPALALREVRNKLETGLKNPRRRGRR